MKYLQIGLNIWKTPNILWKPENPWKSLENCLNYLKSPETSWYVWNSFKVSKICTECSKIENQLIIFIKVLFKKALNHYKCLKYFYLVNFLGILSSPLKSLESLESTSKLIYFSAFTLNNLKPLELKQNYFNFLQIRCMFQNSL